MDTRDTAELDFAAILDHLHDGLYVVDRSRRIIYWNKAAERLTGFLATEVIGRRCSDNILVHVDASGTSLCNGPCPLVHTIRDRMPRECSVFLHHKQGHRVPVTVRTSPLTDRSGEVVGAVEMFSRTPAEEDLRAKVAVLERLSLIDPLTQLPNRRYLESEVESHLAMLRRSGVPFGVVMLDVDRFKAFNDECGHDAGDRALRTLADTCAAVVRPFDSIGRWGGEEFVGVFPKVDPEALGKIAGRLCRLVRCSRVESGSGPRTMTVSIGATIARATDTKDSVLRRADALMYESKRRGRDRVTVDPGDAGRACPGMAAQVRAPELASSGR